MDSTPTAGLEKLALSEEYGDNVGDRGPLGSWVAQFDQRKPGGRKRGSDESEAVLTGGRNRPL